MKRTPLRRETPLRRTATLKRGKPIERRRSQPRQKRNGPPRDPAYLAFVRRHPCVVPGCRRKAEAHHYGSGGVATKCSDYETVPLCHWHHVDLWHGSRDGIPGKTRAEWQEAFESAGAAILRAYRSTDDF